VAPPSAGGAADLVGEASFASVVDAESSRASLFGANPPLRTDLRSAASTRHRHGSQRRLFSGVFVHRRTGYPVRSRVKHELHRELAPPGTHATEARGRPDVGCSVTIDRGRSG
jgi:hypothetical protein